MMSMPADEFFERMKPNLYGRTFERAILKDPAWQKVADQMYRPLCDPGMPICRGLFEGALLGGWQSATMQFSTSLLQLYEINREVDLSAEHAEQTRRQLVEFYYGYSQYIRPLLIGYQ